MPKQGTDSPDHSDGRRSIASLPEEILIDILLIGVSEVDRWSYYPRLRCFALVSKLWHALIMQTPAFWTEINMGQPTSQVKAILKRSRNADLRVHLQVNYQFMTDEKTALWLDLCREKHRWADVNILPDDQNLGLRTVLDALDSPAVKLNRFTLVPSRRPGAVQALPLTQHHTPNLTEINLACTISGSDPIISILREFPSLKRAFFGNCHLPLQARVTAGVWTSFCLPNLELLDLPPMTPTTLNYLGGLLQAPKCLRLSVKLVREEPLPPDAQYAALSESLIKNFACLQALKKKPCEVRVAYSPRNHVHFHIKHVDDTSNTSFDLRCSNITASPYYTGGSSSHKLLGFEAAVWVAWLRAFFIELGAPIVLQVRIDPEFIEEPDEATHGILALPNVTKVRLLGFEDARMLSKPIIDENGSPHWAFEEATELAFELALENSPFCISTLEAIVQVRRGQSTLDTSYPAAVAQLPPPAALRKIGPFRSGDWPGESRTRLAEVVGPGVEVVWI